MILSRGHTLRKAGVNLAAVFLASFLFAAAFPNLISQNGFSFLGWIAFVPVFWLASRSRLISAPLWGALYGFFSYAFFNYWLSVFHPLAGVIVYSIYTGYMALVFLLLKLASTLFPRKGFIVQWILWLGFEYMKTRLFVGYPYGISGYSQWQFTPLIQIADIFGVFGVSALLVFPSAWIAHVLKEGIAKVRLRSSQHWLSIALWGLAVCASLLYSIPASIDYSNAPTKNIALIQNNADPWRGDIIYYRQNFFTLRDLSEAALKEKPDTDLVVWSETAFVPRIYWHLTYRDSPEYYSLVKELLDYLANKEQAFVIGNDDGRRRLNEQGQYERIDYNAVMLFQKGINTQIYRKLHLVPFTEHFPYEKQLPFFYKALIEADTHFWEKGTEYTVFDVDGFKFSTPICFEDTFGYLSRAFVQKGAQVIVNLTNDAWANSLPSQMQHATMAVFRAIENRRSLVRATASGQTCAIDPNGKILAMAEPFKENYLNVTIPVYTGKTTLYTKYGDTWIKVITLLGPLLLLSALLYFGFRKIFKRR